MLEEQYLTGESAGSNMSCNLMVKEAKILEEARFFLWSKIIDRRKIKEGVYEKIDCFIFSLIHFGL